MFVEQFLLKNTIFYFKILFSSFFFKILFYINASNLQFFLTIKITLRFAGFLLRLLRVKEYNDLYFDTNLHSLWTKISYWHGVCLVDASVGEADVESKWKDWTGADSLHDKLTTSVIDSHLYKVQAIIIFCSVLIIWYFHDFINVCTTI